LLAGSSIGHNLVLTSFGESHGKCVGSVLDGCPAGLELDEKDIQKMLDLRRPGQSLVSTQRKEGDIVEILSGVFRDTLQAHQLQRSFGTKIMTREVMLN